ncbi:MAG: response regulator, partial [Campylobacterota bacterium]|nr:response regulator [Campylobacterota bacterium]
MKIKPKVLIVDDAPANIHMFTTMLKDDYTIIAATSGEKAIKLAQKDSKPDMILLDIIMPDMDGYEVCKILKEDSSTKDIPVIFVTSLNSIEDQEKGLAYGGVEYITKPISKNIVKHRINTHLKIISLDKQEHIENNNQIKSNNMNKSKKSILVVDDVPENIQVIVEILKQEYTVSVATSGQKAIDMIDNGLAPDMILLDVVMPDMDGYEACKILKKKNKHIPIMFLTILENEKDIVKGLHLGAVDYVSKPVEPTVLKARIKTHLELQELQNSLLDDIKSKNELLIQQSKFAMLGEMFENITHQWIQPLSIISMSVGNIQLQKDLDTLNDDILFSSIEDIDNSTNLLSHTVNDFRDFLNIHKNTKIFDLTISVTKPIKILKRKLEKKNINVINLIKNGCELESYENYIIQVLMNLLNNAIDQFTENRNKQNTITIDITKN